MTSICSFLGHCHTCFALLVMSSLGFTPTIDHSGCLLCRVHRRDCSNATTAKILVATRLLWQNLFSKSHFKRNKICSIRGFVTPCKRSLGEGNSLQVSHSVHRGVSVWCHFLPGSLFHVLSGKEGLCAWSHVPSGGLPPRGLCSGVSVGGLCSGISVERGLCLGVSVHGVSVWVVRILLEYFLYLFLLRIFFAFSHFSLEPCDNSIRALSGCLSSL